MCVRVCSSSSEAVNVYSPLITVTLLFNINLILIVLSYHSAANNKFWCELCVAVDVLLVNMLLVITTKKFVCLFVCFCFFPYLRRSRRDRDDRERSRSSHRSLSSKYYRDRSRERRR